MIGCSLARIDLRSLSFLESPIICAAPDTGRSLHKQIIEASWKPLTNGKYSNKRHGKSFKFSILRMILRKMCELRGTNLDCARKAKMNMLQRRSEGHIHHPGLTPYLATKPIPSSHFITTKGESTPHYILEGLRWG